VRVQVIVHGLSVGISVCIQSRGSLAARKAPICRETECREREFAHSF